MLKGFGGVVMSDFYAAYDALASAIGNRESRLMLEARGRIEQSRNLVPAQHHGQVARIGHPDQLARQVGPIDSVGEEEPQRRRNLFMVGVGTPASHCSIWNRRTSSDVAVSGERLRNVAKRPTSRM